MGDTLSNPQLRDAAKIASAEIKNRVDNHQGFGLISKNYLAPLNTAITNYVSTNKIGGQDQVDFYNNVQAYYSGYAGVAMMSKGGADFLQLDRLVNNSGVGDARALRLTQASIQYNNSQLLGILNISANVAVGEAAGGISPSVGVGPRGAFKGTLQQEIVIAGKVTKLENTGLNKFFADNTTMLKTRVDKQIFSITQKNAEFVNPPSYVTRETLLKYRQIALKAINGTKGDPVGAQTIRVELINEALKIIK